MSTRVFKAIRYKCSTCKHPFMGVDEYNNHPCQKLKREVEKYCPTCKMIKEDHGGFGPSHFGSSSCQSGSLASGGNNSHCSCDMCF